MPTRSQPRRAARAPAHAAHVAHVAARVLRFATPLLAALLCACAAAPPPAPLAPAATLAEFSARRLEAAVPGPAAAASDWDLAQWLAAALQLNPRLAEERAEVLAAAAAERTAAQLPNPTMELFADYLKSAATSGAWLYGVSLDFLLRQPGERSRARRRAALESALAESDLSEALWQVRATLRLALLDAAAAHDEQALLATLVGERASLLEGDRRRLTLGDIARPQLLGDELELQHARQRLQQAQARSADARVRLAAAVGVPAAALGEAPLRWDEWAAIAALCATTPERWRTAALIGRPQIVRALRTYDLAELALRSEAARWPQLHVTPAYAWGGDGLREPALTSISQESAVGVSFELPLFNQHRGEIGEALARRAVAGEHLKAVQAGIFAEIERAESAWPAARQAWADSASLAALAERQQQSQQRALAAGAGDRSEALAAQIALTEAQLAVLQAAYNAQLAFGSLEDAYRRPLQGEEGVWPTPSAPSS
jgi:cobalt-zinc-cadmium efflux system outer membrane protein